MALPVGLDEGWCGRAGDAAEAIEHDRARKLLQLAMLCLGNLAWPSADDEDRELGKRTADRIAAFLRETQQ